MSRTSPITVDPELLRAGAHLVAIIRCHSMVDVLELRRALAALGEGADLVAFHDASTPQATTAAMAQHAPPVATATPVTDALKRVSAGRITGSVDRASVVRAGLPMMLDLRRLQARLEELPRGAVLVGALLDPQADVSLLDPSRVPDE